MKAEDLQKELPSASGFSAINLWRMRAFYLSWTKDVKKLQKEIRKTRDGKLSQLVTVFAGKMNFYLSAVDDKLRLPADHPTIGIILCKKRNKIVVEYALRDTNKPMGVATYRMLPAKLKAELPSAQQFEDWIKRNAQDQTRPRAIDR